MSQSAPLYANQQLRSVSLETNFRGRAAALARLELIQEAFDDRLPHLFVPNAIEGHAISLQPFQLRSTPGSRGESLAIAVNQATYLSFDYPGFESFLRSALELLPRTYQLLGVQQLTRVIVRYENLIAVERQGDGVISLEKIVNSIIPAGMGAESRLTNLRAEWSSKWERGLLDVSASVENMDGLDTLRLGIAATIEPAGAVDRLAAYAQDAHLRARSCFESLITNEFREILKGSGGSAG